MSAATSFSAPAIHRPGHSEHLSVHTTTDPMDCNQSLASAVESIDEVQLGLDAQVDEESTGDDRESDQLDTDPITVTSVAGDIHPSIDELSPEHGLEALNAYEQAIATGDIDIGSPALVPEPTSEATQANAVVDTLFSNSTNTATLDSDPVPYVSATAIIDQDLAPREENGDLGSSMEALPEVPVLDEHDFALLAQNLAPEIEVRTEVSPVEQDSVQHDIEGELNHSGQSPQPDAFAAHLSAPEAQDDETTSHPVVEPLRRMDDETIPVTEHSKDTIIGILNDAPATVADESIHLATLDEQVPAEGQPVVFEKTVAASSSIPETPQVDATLVERPRGRTPVSVVAHLEHIQVFEPDKEVDQTTDEDTIMEVERVPEAGADTNDVEMDELALDAEDESALAMDAEEAIAVETDAVVPDDPAPTLTDTTQDDETMATEQITTVIHQTTTIEQTEQPLPESDAQPTAEANPEIIITDTDVTTATTTTTATIVPAEAAPVDQITSTSDTEGMTETEQILRAAQIQQEQDATAETPINEDLDVPAGKESAATDTSPDEEVVPTPDGTAPKDSGSPLRARPEMESEVTETTPLVETAGPIDPAITQGEGTIASEPAKTPEPLGPQHHIATDQSPAPAVFERATPDWDDFDPHDEDAPGSPEVPDPSSDPSLATANPIPNPTTNPVDSSSGEAPDTNPTSNDLAAPTTSHKSDQKRRLIMEVVIPIPGNKQVIKQEPVRGRLTSKSKATTSPPSSSPPKAGPSSARRPRSASASSAAETPLSSGDEGENKSPTRSASITRTRRRDSRKQFGPRKRTPKKPGKKHTPTAHAARSLKVEVVMSKTAKPRQSLLRRTGSIPSGNNVKFVSVSPVIGKRKAESEPEDAQAGEEEEEEDPDAEGEDDEGYEDVEDVKVEAELPKPRARKPRTSPIKRPRRSNEARKMPTKLPEVITAPATKRRRLRR